MIQKTARGWEVKAQTGRCMGIYQKKELAEARLKQIEFFKRDAKERLMRLKSKKK